MAGKKAGKIEAGNSGGDFFETGKWNTPCYSIMQMRVHVDKNCLGVNSPNFFLSLLTSVSRSGNISIKKFTPRKISYYF